MNTTDAAKMGALIRQLRSKCGFSRKSFAAALELSESHIGGIENGTKTPSLDTFVELLNLLNTSADYVLQDSLSVGYRPKSSLLESRINRLTNAQKAQVLTMVDALVDSFEKH